MTPIYWKYLDKYINYSIVENSVVEKWLMYTNKQKKNIKIIFFIEETWKWLK